jgi:PKHD-type hydroxylase
MYTILHGVLTPEAAASAAQALHALPLQAWADGADSAGSQARAVKDNLQLPHEHPVAVAVRQQVLVALDRSHEFLARALPARIFTPRINRYDPEHPSYGWHIDNALRLRPDGQSVRTDLSCTVMLSGPDDCEGGELLIREGDVQHRVKPQAGDAVLYRSGLLHEVRPVTRGCRLACFFWVQSHVPGDAERQLLHELDTHLSALRGSHGDCENTRALMGVYHNLLRLWVR